MRTVLCYDDAVYEHRSTSVNMLGPVRIFQYQYEKKMRDEAFVCAYSEKKSQVLSRVVVLAASDRIHSGVTKSARGNSLPIEKKIENSKHGEKGTEASRARERHFFPILVATDHQVTIHLFLRPHTLFFYIRPSSCM